MHICILGEHEPTPRLHTSGGTPLFHRQDQAKYKSPVMSRCDMQNSLMASCSCCYMLLMRSRVRARLLQPFCTACGTSQVRGSSSASAAESGRDAAKAAAEPYVVCCVPVHGRHVLHEHRRGQGPAARAAACVRARPLRALWTARLRSQGSESYKAQDSILHSAVE